MTETRLACYYSPRRKLRPVLVAVVDRKADLDRFWDPEKPIYVWPHGIYILEETTMPKKDPENLYNTDGTFPADYELEEEFSLLEEQGMEHDGGWVARRLHAIFSFLGRRPEKRERSPGDPGKIPNRRLP